MLDSQRCHVSAEAGDKDDEDIVTQSALLLPMLSVLHCPRCPHRWFLSQQRLLGGDRRLWEGKMSALGSRTRCLPSRSAVSRIQSLQSACTLVDVFSVVG